MSWIQKPSNGKARVGYCLSNKFTCPSLCFELGICFCIWVTSSSSFPSLLPSCIWFPEEAPCRPHWHSWVWTLLWSGCGCYSGGDRWEGTIWTLSVWFSFYRWHALCQRWLVTVPALLTKLWTEECDPHSELIVCISLIKCHPYIVTALTPAPPDVPTFEGIDFLAPLVQYWVSASCLPGASPSGVIILKWLFSKPIFAKDYCLGLRLWNTEIN